MIEDHGSTTDGYHLINRMAFAQYFSAFEAYLADTLILHVTLNDDAMSSLLKTNKTLREMKLACRRFWRSPTSSTPGFAAICARLSTTASASRRALQIRPWIRDHNEQTDG